MQLFYKVFSKTKINREIKDDLFLLRIMAGAVENVPFNRKAR
jgi:hypothetical protein